jgi:hypothetical protein
MFYPLKIEAFFFWVPPEPFPLTGTTGFGHLFPQITFMVVFYTSCSIYLLLDSWLVWLRTNSERIE